MPQTNPTPLILVVTSQASTSDSIGGVLHPKGHVILKATTGHQALDLAAKVSADAIIVDVEVPDMGAIDLVLALRETATVYPTTPILLLSKTELGRARRLEAFAAGVWDLIVDPVDANELVLRMDTFVRAKQQADHVREEGLTDVSTGFYNVRGVLRRTREINADAVRFDRPLTCIAFGPQQDPDTQDANDSKDEQLSAPVAEALRDITRVSDTVGRLGPGEFVVVAPGTDPTGAVRLADRVLEALQRAGVDDSEIRAGFCSMEPSDETSAEDLLLRATVALRRAQAEAGSFRVRSYEA